MRQLFLFFTLVLTFLAHAGDAAVDIATRDDSWTVPAELTLRARVTAITPAEPVDINWRQGGEGLGGTVTHGIAAQKLPLNEWSPPIPVKSFATGKFPAKLFVTFTFGRGGNRKTGGHSTDAILEFEFKLGDKIIKTFQEKGPDGGSVGIVIPASRLTAGKTPESPEFLNELTGLKAYAEHRLAQLAAARPEAPKSPKPKLFSIVTNLAAYGTGHGYATRHTNKAIVETECSVLRMLGVNGFASAPDFLRDMAAKKEGYAKDFSHTAYLQLGGYPVPSAKAGQNIPEAGCPFAPGVAARQAAIIEKGVADAKLAGVDEVWWRTEDEIGVVTDRAPEGKAHIAQCPRCAAAYQTYVKQFGLTPADFGAPDWSAVKPANIYDKTAPPITTRAQGLNAYHTAMFVNYASAQLFTPLRDALAKHNEAALKSRGATPVPGTQPSALGTRHLALPFIYSFALRGNTFLMSGHSLDFFDFYRHADNAFVYETSNRDARVWQWDSYLCDVGRVVSEKQHLQFGIYVKPHRGAPIQRTLAAAARGATLLYWYTYGPDYVKGDSFAAHPECLVDVSRVSELLAKSEHVLYGAKPVHPAQVVVVNPRSSEIWARLTGASPAAYENAKWTYTALQHAHIPVDPLDEVMLATEDLSRYKVIYINGANLTRAAAEKVAAWVRAGGTLATSAGGLARDEANQPLEILQPILGLKNRKPVELFYQVAAYGATNLERYDDPKRILAPSTAQLFTHKIIVGKETLTPDPAAVVTVEFGDNSPACVVNPVGKGKGVIVAFYPGLEYSAAVRRADFDMSQDLHTFRTYADDAAVEAGARSVSASEPLVETLFVQNEATKKRALVLINWAYRVTEKRLANVPFKDITITLPKSDRVEKALSTALNQALEVRNNGDATEIKVPLINEGDVLLLDE